MVIRSSRFFLPYLNADTSSWTIVVKIAGVAKFVGELIRATNHWIRLWLGYSMVEKKVSARDLAAGKQARLV